MKQPITCKKCHALLGQHQEKCRQCGNRVYGSIIFDFVAEKMGPKKLINTPITSTLFVGNILIYVLAVLIAGFDQLLSFSTYSLLQIGSNVFGRIYEGEIGRLLTSMWLHADLIHLAMNSWALIIVGPIIESKYGGMKTLCCYLLGGVLGSVLSAYYHGYFMGQWYGPGSIGASGAICALIGAGTYFAHFEKDLRVFNYFKQFIISIIIFGVLMFNSIDNAGHFGGLIGGAIVAWLFCNIKALYTNNQLSFKISDIINKSILLLTVLGFAHQLYNSAPFGYSLEKDFQQSSAFFGQFKYGPKYEWQQSSQYENLNNCYLGLLEVRKDSFKQVEDKQLKKARFNCEFAIRSAFWNLAYSGELANLAQLQGDKSSQKFYSWLHSKYLLNPIK